MVRPHELTALLLVLASCLISTKCLDDSQSDVEKRQAPMFVGKRQTDTLDGKRQAPLFIGKREAPLFIGKRDTPDLEETQQPLSSGSKRHAPMFVGKRKAPMFFGKRQAPLFVGKRHAPMFVGKRRAPMFFGKRQAKAPLFFGKRQAKAPLFFGKRQAPLFVGKRHAPMFVGKREAPLFFGKRQAPMFVGKRHMPSLESEEQEELSESKRYTPMFVGKRRAPMFFGKRQAPMFVGKRHAPMFVGKRQAPMFVGKRRAPMFFGKRNAPMFVGKRFNEQSDFDKGSLSDYPYVSEDNMSYENDMDSAQFLLDDELNDSDADLTDDASKRQAPMFVGRRGIGLGELDSEENFQEDDPAEFEQRFSNPDDQILWKKRQTLTRADLEVLIARAKEEAVERMRARIREDKKSNGPGLIGKREFDTEGENLTQKRDALTRADLEALIAQANVEAVERMRARIREDKKSNGPGHIGKRDRENMWRESLNERDQLKRLAEKVRQIAIEDMREKIQNDKRLHGSGWLGKRDDELVQQIQDGYTR